MKTEFEIASTLKRMLSSIPLSDITVKEITKRCHVNRQTFYYHYHDVFDVLTMIFLSEKIEGIEKVDSIKAMVTCIYNYYNKNAEFMDASLNSAGMDLVKEFIYNNCYQSILRFVIAHDKEKLLTINDRKSIARFYASAYSNSIIYYLLNIQHKSLNNLLKSFEFAGEEALTNSIKKSISSKENEK